jgi:hypothetical protein
MLLQAPLPSSPLPSSLLFYLPLLSFSKMGRLNLTYKLKRRTTSDGKVMIA